eukprot:4077166-Amphidinium_carterae.2
MARVVLVQVMSSLSTAHTVGAYDVWPSGHRHQCHAHAALLPRPFNRNESGTEHQRPESATSNKNDYASDKNNYVGWGHSISACTKSTFRGARFVRAPSNYLLKVAKVLNDIWRRHLVHFV